MVIHDSLWQNDFRLRVVGFGESYCGGVGNEGPLPGARGDRALSGID
jgi:hypothetical protein